MKGRCASRPDSELTVSSRPPWRMRREDAASEIRSAKGMGGYQIQVMKFVAKVELRKRFRLVIRALAF
ncbi:MAG: hypothetical protein H0T92_15840 [Pyrinomonadaceae bacterium]|nr:hypothetical protein [Pyrinomonadaceae bacterium]